MTDADAIIAFALARAGLPEWQIAPMMKAQRDNLTYVLRHPKKYYRVPRDLTPPRINALVGQYLEQRQ